MTTAELRAHSEYAICMGKIRGYRPGFILFMNYTQIPTAKANALKIILKDACDEGWLESIAFYVNLEGHITGERFVRSNKGWDA